MTERLNAIVGARIGEFRRKMAEARAIAAAFPKKIVTSVEMVRNDLSPRVDKFRARMDKLADAYRDMNVIAAEAMWGGLVTSLPMLVALIPGLIAVLATAGVQIGVMAGGLMGLVSSFGLAGAAAGGMAAFMVPLIQDLNRAQADVRAGNKSLSDFSGTMRDAVYELLELRKQFTKTKEAMAPALYDAMAQGMANLRVIIDRVTTGLVGTAEAAADLMWKMSEAINNGPDIQKTFEWFNKRGPEAFRNWGEIAGWTIRGVLNLLRAFDPLAQSVEEGLLNMTKRFSEWAAGLGESKKFQEFIEYVKRNGPVLMATFGNIITGIVNLFAAFAPLSEDMMNGFRNMTERFKEWSANLSENEGFKSFVNYIRENGPAMIDLIGNLWNFLIELGKGFAYVGEWLMPIVNGFLEWANALMKANPNVARSVAVMFTLFGVFKAIAPIVIGAVSLFSGFFKAVGAGFSAMARIAIPYITLLLRQFDQFIIKIVMGALRIIGQFGMLAGRIAVFMARIVMTLLRFAGPWGWLIAAVIFLAGVIIRNWDSIKQWTLQTFAKVYIWIKQKWQQIKAVTVAVAVAIWNYIKEKWNQLQTWTVKTFVKIYTSIKQKFEQAKAIVKTVALAIWNNIKEKFEQIKNTVRDKIEEAKNRAREKFQAMKDAIFEKIEAAKTTVQEGLESIKGFFENLSLKDAGKAIIQSAIDGIVSMKDNILGKVEEVVGGIRALWPFSPAKTGPLSDIHRMDFGGPISKSIDRMKPEINRAMTKATAGLRATVSAAGITAPSVNPVTNVSNYAPEIPTDYEREDKAIYLQADGRTIAQVLDPHQKSITKEQGRVNVALNKLSAQ